MLGRRDPVVGAAGGVQVLVIATPDDAVAEVAEAVKPQDGTVVAHLSGSLGLGVLAPHARRAAMHPLVALPNPDVGSRRLLGAWFAVAGDAMATAMANALGGRTFAVADDDRAAYHAAASIASNHLVALLSQVERLADQVGVPFDAYLDLVRATVGNVAELGARRALTGPAARGDEATLARHLAALPEE